MTNEELTVLADLASRLVSARHEAEIARTEHNGAKALHDEIKRLEGKECELAERNAMATFENEDLKKRCSELMAERDDARRKLGALTLCVGFIEDYDAKHPKKSLEAFKAAVKQCIDENHIVLTEGGMAK